MRSGRLTTHGIESLVVPTFALTRLKNIGDRQRRGQRGDSREGGRFYWDRRANRKVFQVVRIGADDPASLVLLATTEDEALQAGNGRGRSEREDAVLG